MSDAQSTKVKAAIGVARPESSKGVGKRLPTLPLCAWFALTASLISLSATGCRQQMAEQPSYRPLQPSDFFGDERSARHLVPNTVAWGEATGSVNSYRVGSDQPGDVFRTAVIVGSAAGPWMLAWTPVLAGGPFPSYTTEFPVPVTAELMKRGQERFLIFCAICHDVAGTGRGKIVERGYLQPPNYALDLSRGYQRRGIEMLLRDAPVGYYFEVITNGFGGMPDYAAQVPPRDRWAIIAYIRALQLSQQARLADLPARARELAKRRLEERRDNATAIPR
jgi:mono/diheme cytochrome c family protein